MNRRRRRIPPQEDLEKGEIVSCGGAETYRVREIGSRYTLLEHLDGTQYGLVLKTSVGRIAKAEKALEERVDEE